MVTPGKATGLTIRLKIGYGLASVGDTAIYNILMIYALFYMTEVVHMSSVNAGTVIFIGSSWNALFIGVIGSVSDRFAFRSGRRYPYMKISVLPIMLLTVLMYTDIGGNPAIQVLYYTIVNTCLWTAHSMYVVPYEALGAELTGDSDERTSLRSYARFFMGIGNIFGMVLVLSIVDFFMRGEADAGTAWQWTAIIIAIVSGLSMAGSCALIKKEATKIAPYINPNTEIAGPFRDYIEILRLRPFRYLLVTTLCFASANVFVCSDLVYFMKYNLLLPDSAKSFVFLFLTIAGLILTPIIAAAARVFDKKYTMAAAFTITGVGLLALGIFGIPSVSVFIVFIAFFSVGSSAYWQLIFSLVYDISEADELQYGKRREAAILSASKIFLRIATAISVQILGIVLYAIGYVPDAAAQSARTLEGLLAVSTLTPAVLFLFAAFSILRYPITRGRHWEMRETLDAINRVYDK